MTRKPTNDDALAKQAEAQKGAREKALEERRQARQASLVAFLEKRLLTACVGGLACVEAYFGHLWGEGKSEEELTESERAWRAHFQALRDEILDNGNRQIRAMKQEMGLYAVELVGTRIRVGP